jgi:hypothetical protein
MSMEEWIGFMVLVVAVLGFAVWRQFEAAVQRMLDNLAGQDWQLVGEPITVPTVPVEHGRDLTLIRLRRSRLDGWQLDR